MSANPGAPIRSPRASPIWRLRLGDKDRNLTFRARLIFAKGQYPAAVLLSCIDSRASAELAHNNMKMHGRSTSENRSVTEVVRNNCNVHFDLLERTNNGHRGRSASCHKRSFHPRRAESVFWKVSNGCVARTVLGCIRPIRVKRWATRKGVASVKTRAGENDLSRTPVS